MATKSGFLSEFEQEFELDDEFELTDEAEAELDTDDESDYLSEWDGEYEFEGDEFEDSDSNNYEERLYEVFSGTYEHEFEFENDLNRIMYELEEDFFFKNLRNKIRNLARNPMIKSLANKALGAIPGGAGDLIKTAFKDPRTFLKSAITKFGPQLANMVVPGSGIALGAVLGNSEMETEDYARNAARTTVQLANEVYSNFADEIAKTDLSRNPTQANIQLKDMARKSFKKGYQTLKLGTEKSQFVRVHRKVEETMVQGKPGKRVTILYKRV